MFLYNLLYLFFFLNQGPNSTQIWEFMTSNDGGNFAQFLSAIAAILAFFGLVLTLVEMKNQRKISQDSLNELKLEHENSIRPDIIIPQVDLFYCMDEWVINRLEISELNDQICLDVRPESSIDIVNIGLGPAKDIQINWKLNTEEIYESLTVFKSQICRRDIYYDRMYEEKFFDNFLIPCNFENNYIYDPVKIEYIVPINWNLKAIKMNIPSNFFCILSKLMTEIKNYYHEYLFEEIVSNLSEIILIELNYKDIKNKPYRSILKLKLENPLSKTKYYQGMDIPYDQFQMKFE